MHINVRRFKLALAGALDESALYCLDQAPPAGEFRVPELDMRKRENFMALFWTLPKLTKNEWGNLWFCAMQAAEMGDQQGLEYLTQYMENEGRYGGGRILRARAWVLGPRKTRITWKSGANLRSAINRVILLGGQHGTIPVFTQAEASVQITGTTYKVDRSKVEMFSKFTKSVVSHSLPPPDNELDLALPEISVPYTRVLHTLSQAGEVGPLLARFSLGLKAKYPLERWVEEAAKAPKPKSYQLFEQRFGRSVDRSSKPIPMSPEHVALVMDQDSSEMHNTIVPGQKLNITALFRGLVLDYRRMSYTAFVDQFGKPVTHDGRVNYRRVKDPEEAFRLNDALSAALDGGGV